MQKFELENQFEFINRSGIIASNCNAIAFKNIGETVVHISGFPLAVGDAMLSFNNPNAACLDVTKYEIVFKPEYSVPDSELESPELLSSDPKVIVIRTFFKDVK